MGKGGDDRRPRRDERRRDDGPRVYSASERKRVEVDPNSPFAKLSLLKAQMEKGAGGDSSS